MDAQRFELLKMLPFIASTAGGGIDIRVGRIIEGIVIAAIAASIALYAAVQVLDARLVSLEVAVEKVETKIDKMRDDIYRPIIGSGKT